MQRQKHLDCKAERPRIYLGHIALFCPHYQGKKSLKNVNRGKRNMVKKWGNEAFIYKIIYMVGELK